MVSDAKRINYDDLLDADVLAFIAETESWYPPDAVDLSIQEQRLNYNKMCAAMASALPDQVAWEDAAIWQDTHNIPIRKYRVDTEPEAIVIYFHGGGFVVGGLDSHHDVCAEICAHTEFEVISVDYRSSPEHPFPADFEDANAAFLEIASATNVPVVLAGDSAGACLAAAVSRAASMSHSPAGQVLIYPGLGGNADEGSYLEHAHAPLLSREDVLYYHKIRTAERDDLLNDPRCSPLRAESFEALPPSYIVSAQYDPLSSDGEAYFNAIKAAGGHAQWINEAGLVHGYLRARHRTQKGRASFDRILNAISQLGRTGRLPDA